MTQQTLLSQEEIEALLDLVQSSGELGLSSPSEPKFEEPTPATSDELVEKRDFSKPESLPRTELEFYWNESTHAATRVSDLLTKWLRMDVKVECMSIEPALFGSFLASLPTPCLVYRVGAGQGYAQPAALAFDPSVALAVVDRVLGAAGKARFASRILTGVEQTQAKYLATIVARALAEGLAEVLPIEKEVSSSAAMTMRAARYTSSDTPVLIATYSIAGELAETELRLVVPAAAFPRREELGVFQDSAELPPALPEVTVRVSARLGEAQITLHELVELEVGDIIALDSRVEAPISVEVEGRPVAHARIGTVGERLGVTVESLMRVQSTPEKRT